MSMMLGRLFVRCLRLGKKDVRDIDEAIHNLFVKAKRDLDVLPPNHNAIE